MPSDAISNAASAKNDIISEPIRSSDVESRTMSLIIATS